MYTLANCNTASVSTEINITAADTNEWLAQNQLLPLQKTVNKKAMSD